MKVSGLSHDADTSRRTGEPIVLPEVVEYEPDDAYENLAAVIGGATPALSSVSPHVPL